MMGFLLDLPVVFAKKKKPSTMTNMLSTTVFSFTKQREYHVVISKEYLGKGDKVLFVDDFLAYGNAAKGVIDLCKTGRSGAGWNGLYHRESFSTWARCNEKKQVYAAKVWLLLSRLIIVK